METGRSLSHLRVALYGRVSTLDKGQDVNLQLNELREYSDRRGWKISGEYVDNGVSGAKESRPELNRLMADAKKRKFDAIAVWKLDRFGRSLKHLVITLADLESLGIAFVSLRDGLDLSTPSGRLMFQIIGAMGEFERNLIRERVRAGMAHARSKGRKLGRGRLCVDMADVAARRANGESLRAIARDLGVSPVVGETGQVCLTCISHHFRRKFSGFPREAITLFSDICTRSNPTSEPPLVLPFISPRSEGE
jgi:DNA invertase Pin-like site-specific DNA recombinase